MRTVHEPTATQNSLFLPQWWVTQALIALIHGGMAWLSGLNKYWGGRPANGDHQSQY